jgi:hypothetical protein
MPCGSRRRPESTRELRPESTRELLSGWPRPVDGRDASKVLTVLRHQPLGGCKLYGLGHLLYGLAVGATSAPGGGTAGALDNLVTTAWHRTNRTYSGVS